MGLSVWQRCSQISSQVSCRGMVVEVADASVVELVVVELVVVVDVVVLGIDGVVAVLLVVVAPVDSMSQQQNGVVSGQPTSPW